MNGEIPHLTAQFGARTFGVEHRARPFTTNHIYGRVSRHAERNRLVQEWREAFAWLAKEAKLPKLEACVIYAWPMLRDRRVQDVAACNPSVKAAIDGLVDAGVLEDDDPRFVRALAFGPPVQAAPYDALRLLIVEVHDA
jgi:1-acyl-sn-glycerol-3-phosphate acyltransferase